MAFKSILFAAITLYFSASSNSALIDIDWQTSRGNLIIRDTNSGLDWLGLRVTANLSRNTVVANHKIMKRVAIKRPLEGLLAIRYCRSRWGNINT